MIVWENLESIEIGMLFRKICVCFITAMAFMGRPAVAKDSWVGVSGDFIMRNFFWLTSAIIVYERDYEAFIPYFTAQTVNGLSIDGIKRKVRERRPNGMGFDSFPSGHTAQSFVNAAFIHTRYGIWHAAVPYALSTFVAFSRVYEGWHYTHDVVAGALISSLIAYAFTKNFVFEASPDGYKIGFDFKF